MAEKQVKLTNAQIKALLGSKVQIELLITFKMTDATSYIINKRVLHKNQNFPLKK